MKRMIPRLALVATSVVALSGVAASSALAQSNPTITKATQITSESATVSGTIDTTTTPGNSVCYSFEYDTIADYLGNQDNISYTDPVCVVSGSGTIHVSATIGCYPAASCADTDQSPLDPASTYQFILGAQYEAGGSYANAEQLDSPGNGLKFTTLPLGSVKLTSSTAPTARGVATVDLLCASKLPCQGTLQLALKSKGKVLTTKLQTISIKADKAAKVKVTLTKAIEALYAKDNSTLGVRLTVLTTTDQLGLTNKPLTLVAG